MDNFRCAGYVFNSKFDSGNLAQVVLVNIYSDTPAIDQQQQQLHVSTEFNVHTRPDCAGTQWENPNRSWFFFSIHGGEPGKICKINVVNMNKQAKLFNQGMHPVVRVGETGKWERVKDKPVHCMNGDQFCMSFLHKPAATSSPTLRHYYAFTYPFTYAECQDQLDRFAELHQKSAAKVNYIIQRLLAPASDKSHAIAINSLLSDDDETPYRTVNSVGARLARMSRSELESEIYYHRELLVRSVEERRCDLVTITSFLGVQLEREPRLPALFPDTQTVRCNVFAGKPVVFISSRVHPGETPASHVLNGFMKQLLDVKSQVGAALRQRYVFKIVPFLNPDGVYQGCYRSDTLGHNLNRVYQCPSLRTQPTIYAVRKLVRYYHFDEDVPEPEMDSEQQQLLGALAKDQLTDEDCFIMPSPLPMSTQPAEKPVRSCGLASNVDVQFNVESSTTQSSDSEYCVSDGRTSAPEFAAAAAALATTPSCDTSTSTSASLALLDNVSANRSSTDDGGLTVVLMPPEVDRLAGRVFHDHLVPEIKPVLITGAAGVHPKKPLWSKVTSSASAASTRHTIIGYPRVVSRDSVGAAQLSATSSCHQPLIGSKFRIIKRRNTAGSTNPTTTTTDGDRLNNNANARAMLDACGVTRILDNCSAASGPASSVVDADGSNLFLYIDMHGHASKKGVFMYGNHLPTTDEAVECMLLPRLMSMNSHHFHFDSCVFSERNMYSTGKRDGLSKEGSGRVSMYKATGIIKCYTLEGNYNSGKYVNVLPPRGKEPAAKKSNMLVPKYSPLIFEDVGRALGPSILDLTGCNPLSRIQNTDFKTVTGLRHALRTELERVNPRSLVFNSAVPSNKSYGMPKRLKSAKAKAKAAGLAAAAAAAVASTSSACPAPTVQQRKPKQPKQQQRQQLLQPAAAAAKENKSSARSCASYTVPSMKAPCTERLRRPGAASIRPEPGVLELHHRSEELRLREQRLRDRRARLVAAVEAATRSAGLAMASTSTAAAAVASGSTENCLISSGSGSSSGSSNSAIVPSTVAVKRKALKDRPKSATTTAGIGPICGASALKTKPTKRGYSSKDSLRMKKKKKLPKNVELAAGAQPDVVSGGSGSSDTPADGTTTPTEY